MRRRVGVAVMALGMAAMPLVYGSIQAESEEGRATNAFGQPDALEATQDPIDCGTWNRNQAELDHDESIWLVQAGSHVQRVGNELRLYWQATSPPSGAALPKGQGKHRIGPQPSLTQPSATLVSKCAPDRALRYRLVYVWRSPNYWLIAEERPNLTRYLLVRVSDGAQLVTSGWPVFDPSRRFIAFATEQIRDDLWQLHAVIQAIAPKGFEGVFSQNRIGTVTGAWDRAQVSTGLRLRWSEPNRIDLDRDATVKVERRRLPTEIRHETSGAWVID